MAERFQLLIATTAQWEAANHILRNGEIGTEVLVSGQKKMKVGNGVTAWNNLSYSTDDVYPYADLATVANGDIKVGDSLQGQLTNDLLRQVLAPFVSPAFTSFTSASKTQFTYEVGTDLASSFTLNWAISNLENVADATTGIINSSDVNAFTNLGNVNLKDLTYILNSTSNYSYAFPKNINITIFGYDNEAQQLAQKKIDIDWKGLIAWGVNGTGEVSTISHIDAIKAQDTILSNSADRTYDFSVGYPFILIPSLPGIDITGITFTDNDNGLAFAMDLQSVWDNSLPSTVSYNNGNITFDYKIFRGEFYYNAPTSIKVTT